MQRGDEFAQGLERGRKAALVLHQKLVDSKALIPTFAPELDIVVFAPRASSVEEISALSRRIFAESAVLGLHLALADLPATFFVDLPASVKRDRQTLTCLRSVLMKPEHLDWVDRIWEIIQTAAAKSAIPATKPA